VELIRGLYNLKQISNTGNSAADSRRSTAGAVLTVGAFDGLHRGHQTVLNHVVAMAAKRNVKSIVLTLDPLPREFFFPLLAPPRLMSFREKFEGLQALGIDYMLLIKFDEKLRNVEASEFIDDIFVNRLKVGHVVIGDDFHFGHDGKGDYNLLKKAGAADSFTVESTSTIQSVDGGRVSSSRIRDLLQNADFKMAEKLLGRPYSISGKVVYGQQLASRLGVPTANVELHRLRAAMSGVYATEAQVQGEQEWWPGVANVGTRPTINDRTKAILEVHMLGYTDNLYGRRITVRFRHKIRDEQKFDSIDALKLQIHQDIDYARQWFAKH